MSRVHTPITPELAGYIRETTLREPEALRRPRLETEDHPRASCQIAPEQGQFLHLLARLTGARRALALLRKGGLVAADNVLWRGDVADPGARDEETEAIRAFNRKLHEDARVAISMATMGDGLMLACKL